MTGHPDSTVPTLPRKELREYYGDLCKGAGDHSTVHPSSSRGQASFPRRRESTVGGLVPRLRGEDGLQRDLDVRANVAQALGVLPIGVGLGFHRRIIGFPCPFVSFRVIQLWRWGGVIGYLCSFRPV